MRVALELSQVCYGDEALWEAGSRYLRTQARKYLVRICHRVRARLTVEADDSRASFFTADVSPQVTGTGFAALFRIQDLLGRFIGMQHISSQQHPVQ